MTVFFMAVDVITKGRQQSRNYLDVLEDNYSFRGKRGLYEFDADGGT